VEPSVDKERLMGFLMGTPHGTNWWNPWFGDSRDAEQRRDELVGHLTARSAAPVLMVGIAPGHKGARKSGIPFTDPETLGGDGREQTAMHVQSLLRDLNIRDKTVLWNVFPFHPHEVGDDETNRDLTSAEEREFAPLVNHFQPRRRALVLAVGRPAARGMKSIGVEASYVCHPARNNHQKFRDDVTVQVERLRHEGLL